MEVGNNSPSRSIGKQNLRHVEVNSWMMEEKTYGYFSNLLGLRHLQGFYVFDLCKIII